MRKKNQPGCNCTCGVTDPACPCSSQPTSIAMVSSSHTVNSNMFQDATLVYGPDPDAAFSALSIPDNNWWSTATFVSGGGTHYYMLKCTTASKYDLYRAYPHHPTFGTLLDGIRYSWTPGATGNACSPWAMHGGAPYSGSGAVTITLDPS